MVQGSKKIIIYRKDNNICISIRTIDDSTLSIINNPNLTILIRDDINSHICDFSYKCLSTQFKVNIGNLYNSLDEDYQYVISPQLNSQKSLCSIKPSLNVLRININDADGNLSDIIEFEKKPIVLGFNYINDVKMINYNNKTIIATSL